jgi:uncharacterized protein YjbI with pentapeptide repeats
MANDEHVAILKKGVAAWNAWRNQKRYIRPDLSSADFRNANLSNADLSRANLREANLMVADLREANLGNADLSGANLVDADLSGANLVDAVLRDASLFEANLSNADLSNADLRAANLSNAVLIAAILREANLSYAYLREANLREANLSGADLMASILLGTDLRGAILTDCRIHGISAWRLKLEGAKQQNLIITHSEEPTVTVDNIEVAQFIYLMLNNERVRDVIDTITSKAVLILGRFTDERKAVLDALREELRKRDYLPILFDFAPSNARDITETVSLLARMARFVIADITDAKSIPQELAVIVPDLPSVPVQPLLLEGSGEYSMFEHFKRYPWVLETYRYPSSERLIADLGERVIDPAEKWRSKSGEPPPRSVPR